MIRGLYETHFLVSDFERSRNFYEASLGLEVGWIDEAERRLLYWVGARGKNMLGMREVPAEQVHRQHFAFQIPLEEMENAVSFLKERGIQCHNRIDGGESPQVFGWMPAVAIYFKDPDGHLLEFISMLPDNPRPEVGIVSWVDWESEKTGADAQRGER